MYKVKNNSLFKSFNSKKYFCSTNEKPLTTKLFKNNNVLGLYMNLPNTKNAISKDFLKSLKQNIDEINQNINIRTVILMSQSPGYFCTGANLKERALMTESEAKIFVTDLRNTFDTFSNLRVPTICGIDGFALGGGLELALCCDLRIITKNVTVGLTECGLGIIPGAGGTQRLPRLIGVSKAKELIFTAEKIQWERCMELGIANHVVEKYDNLEEKALNIADKIIKNGPLAVSFAKSAINEGFERDINTGLKIEWWCYGGVFGSKDRLEGLKAFAEKRTPNYKGE